VIRFPDRITNLTRRFPDTMHQKVIRQAHAFPPAVTIHGVVTPDNTGEPSRGNFHMALDLTKKTKPPVGVGIPSIRKSVKENILYPLLACQSKDSHGMADVRMNTAV